MDMNIRKTRLKLIGLLFISTVMIAIRNPIVVCIITAAILTLSVRFIRYQVLWQRLSPIFVIGLFVILFQVLFQTTIPIQNRFVEGFIQSFRLISLSLLVFVFTQTTSVSQIVSALSFLPKKLCLLLTISFALIPAILREITDIRIAQQARGFAPKGVNIIRSVFPVLIPLLNRTLTRAEHIAIVLETRGFEE
jgi:energy-coupling factor transporter transmembrane protein EcfT